MKGRKPVPTALKLIRGNPGRYPIDLENEPQPETRIPSCPDHLDDLARAEWDRMANELAELGLLTGLDRAALAGYCVQWSRWIQAEAALKKSGPLTKALNGNIVKSPLVDIANRAYELMSKTLVEFGMTPSSRTRVKVAKPAKKQDPAEKFF